VFFFWQIVARFLIFLNPGYQYKGKKREFSILKRLKGTGRRKRKKEFGKLYVP
jgi:hypothetical protein